MAPDRVEDLAGNGGLAGSGTAGNSDQEGTKQLGASGWVE
jgi:hypothetical protein